MSNDDQVQVKADDIIEAVRFMRKPLSERVRLSTLEVGKAVPPPWLDDDVLAAVGSLGLARYEPVLPKGRKPPAGSMIATDGKGNIFVMVLTPRGLEAAMTGKFDATYVMRHGGVSR